MKHHLFGCLLVAAFMTDACSARRSKWDDIDYSPVYRAYEKRQNDSSYTQPSISSCVDDDLYNCK